MNHAQQIVDIVGFHQAEARTIIEIVRTCQQKDFLADRDDLILILEAVNRSLNHNQKLVELAKSLAEQEL